MLVIACMLTGCAVMDLSTMDTAEPTGKGKRKGMFTIGSGLNMNLIDKDYVNNDNGHVGRSTPIYNSYNYTWGVGSETDFGTRFTFVLNSVGIRLHTKHRLYADSTGYTLAVAPAANAVASWMTSGGFDKSSLSDEFEALSGEMQLLGTKRWNNNIAGSAIIRANRSYLNHILRTHGGFRLNLELSTKAITYMPEIGIEFYVKKNGEIDYVPIISLGTRFKKHAKK